MFDLGRQAIHSAGVGGLCNAASETDLLHMGPFVSYKAIMRAESIAPLPLWPGRRSGLRLANRFIDAQLSMAPVSSRRALQMIECFSKDYPEAREKFLSAARKSGARL